MMISIRALAMVALLGACAHTPQPAAVDPPTHPVAPPGGTPKEEKPVSSCNPACTDNKVCKADGSATTGTCQ